MMQRFYFIGKGKIPAKAHSVLAAFDFPTTSGMQVEVSTCCPLDTNMKQVRSNHAFPYRPLLEGKKP